MPTLLLFLTADSALWQMALQTSGNALPCSNPVSFQPSVVHWGLPAAGLALSPSTLLSVHPSRCALPGAIRAPSSPSPVSPSRPSLFALWLHFPSPSEHKEGQSQQGLAESTFNTLPVPMWVPCSPWLRWGRGPAAPKGTRRTPQPSFWLRTWHLEVTCTLCPCCGDSHTLVAAQLLFLAVWGRFPAASSTSGQLRAGSQQLLPFYF